MSTKVTVKSFIDEVLARLQGDSDGAVAARNARKADSAVRGQLAALEAQRVDDEIALEEAVERLGNAKYPTTPIENAQDYIQSIVDAQEDVDSAQEALDATIESLEYFKALAGDFAKQ